jgi:hypothetical protein
MDIQDSSDDDKMQYHELEQLKYIKSIKNNVQFLTWLIIISLILFILTFIGPILILLDRL